MNYRNGSNHHTIEKRDLSEITAQRKYRSCLVEYDEFVTFISSRVPEVDKQEVLRRASEIRKYLEKVKF
jgi:hypothetical protein